DRRLLVRGRGEQRLTAAAALTGDARTALLYVPELRHVTVDLARLRGPRIRARWFDPVDGSHHPVPRAPFQATGLRDFHPGRLNAGGRPDWVLRLDSTR